MFNLSWPKFNYDDVLNFKLGKLDIFVLLLTLCVYIAILIIRRKEIRTIIPHSQRNAMFGFTC